MNCDVCGAQLEKRQTDLPFKVEGTSIVILKNLPVFQCQRCPNYLIEDCVMARIDEILAKLDSDAELEVVRYAA